MSPTRTRNSRTTTFAIPVLGLVVAAALAASVSAWPAGGQARPAASSAHPVTAQVAPGPRRDRPAVLDAFTAVSVTKATRRRVTRRLTPKQIARQMIGTFRWRRWEFKYLNLLWSRESSWNVFATNPFSGAYGIPQAVPGDKMASAGANWESSARTQIRWGMRYIKTRYGTPWAAWQHELADGWY